MNREDVDFGMERLLPLSSGLSRSTLTFKQLQASYGTFERNNVQFTASYETRLLICSRVLELRSRVLAD
jgi:hypothetical protein